VSQFQQPIQRQQLVESQFIVEPAVQFAIQFAVE
jgi:hypothetical protein